MRIKEHDAKYTTNFSVPFLSSRRGATMGKKCEDIEEISLEELQSVEVGGNYTPVLFADMLTKPLTYLVVDAKGIKTTYGVRIDFIVQSEEGNRYKLSSWNMLLKEKYQPLALIGRKLRLEQSSTNEKKISCEVL